MIAELVIMTMTLYMKDQFSNRQTMDEVEQSQTVVKSKVTADQCKKKQKEIDQMVRTGAINGFTVTVTCDKIKP